MRPKLWKWSKWFWYRVIIFALNHAGWSSRGVCANRITYVCGFGALEMTTVIRNTRGADGYSREELYGMLSTIRKCEKEMGWKVPEPQLETAA